ncbi:PREDICTED: bone sialoprotein 2 [Lipotes vexillifer]|uniref:Integrin-binding sialoprotein n=1 Tax=Lipotes vexillifer TaxID=118797 RepID=A0A340WUL4_LIPVE|nr:PREDICTED: bone sialoprotein 2 [Lipotes vexillifer]
MKTALILLSILGMACALSMKNLHRRGKLDDSEENGVYKYRPRYYLYKHAYFYPPLKRFPVQSSSDLSEENGNGDSSEEEEEKETSNEEENNEENEDSDGNEDEESEAENTTLSITTLGYGEETAPGTGYIGLAAMQLPTQAGALGKKATEGKESDEEAGEENENEAGVDDNEQGVNGTSASSTEIDSGHGSSGGDNGEQGSEEGVTAASEEGTTVAGGQDDGGSKATPSLNGGFEPTAPPRETYGATPPPSGETTTPGYEGEYEQTGTNEYDSGYEIYENENGEPRGDNYRAYEDEYSYYKGQSYDGYDAQDYYYHQ